MKQGGGAVKETSNNTSTPLFLQDFIKTMSTFGSLDDVVQVRFAILFFFLLSFVTYLFDYLLVLVLVLIHVLSPPISYDLDDSFETSKRRRTTTTTQSGGTRY